MLESVLAVVPADSKEIMDGAFRSVDLIALVEDGHNFAVGEAFAAKSPDEFIVGFEPGAHGVLPERIDEVLSLAIHVSNHTGARDIDARTRAGQGPDKSRTEPGRSRTASGACPGAVRVLSGLSRGRREA